MSEIIDNLERQFTLGNGWTYATVTDEYADCRKLTHFVVCDEATAVIDWSPYDVMAPEQVERWIQLGMPKRQGCAPLRVGDLLELSNRQYERLRSMTPRPAVPGNHNGETP